MSRAAPKWEVVGGSSLGGRHVTSGAPNQDAWQSGSVDHRGHRFVVMAVADGHGGSRYIRSDVGSRFAVETAIDVVEEAILSGLFDGAPRKVEREVRRVLPERLVSTWSQRCLDHLAISPFRPEEEARAGAPLDVDPLLSYGSTLLVSVLTPTACVVLQLGDGDTLISGEEGNLVLALPPDERLTGGETTSLCLPEAAADFRIAVVDNPVPTLVVLATDGYGVAFVDPDWRQTVVDDLLNQVGSRGMDSVASSLPGWLADSAQVGGDDVTVVVAHRMNPRASVGRASAGPVSTGRALTAPAAGSRSTASIVVVGLLALLAGGFAGWGLAKAMIDEPVIPVQVSTTDPVATSTTLVGTSVATRPPATAETPTSSTFPDTSIVPGVGGGSGADEAWILGTDGVLVRFRPDATDPAPVLEAVSNETSRTVAFAWGQVWVLEEGVLTSNGAPVDELGLELVFSGIEFENGLLWLLSDDAAWLVAYAPGSICVVAPIGDPDPSQAEDPEEVPTTCSVRP